MAASRATCIYSPAWPGGTRFVVWSSACSSRPQLERQLTSTIGRPRRLPCCVAPPRSSSTRFPPEPSATSTSHRGWRVRRRSPASPSWGAALAASWERDWLTVRVTCRATAREPGHEARKASMGDVPHAPGSGCPPRERRIRFRPGKYTVTAFVEDEESKGTGNSRFRSARISRARATSSSRPAGDAGGIPDSPGPKVTKLGRTFVPNPMCLVGTIAIEVFMSCTASLQGGSPSTRSATPCFPAGTCWVSSITYGRGECPRSPWSLSPPTG
jgi:hypothetical protein